MLRVFHSRSHVCTIEGGIHHQGGTIFPVSILDEHIMSWSFVDAIGETRSVKFQ